MEKVKIIRERKPLVLPTVFNDFRANIQEAEFFSTRLKSFYPEEYHRMQSAISHIFNYFQSYCVAWRHIPDEAEQELIRPYKKINSQDARYIFEELYGKDPNVYNE